MSNVKEVRAAIEHALTTEYPEDYTAQDLLRLLGAAAAIIDDLAAPPFAGRTQEGGSDE